MKGTISNAKPSSGNVYPAVLLRKSSQTPGLDDAKYVISSLAGSSQRALFPAKQGVTTINSEGASLMFEPFQLATGREVSETNTSALLKRGTLLGEQVEFSPSCGKFRGTHGNESILFSRSDVLKLPLLLKI